MEVKNFNDFKQQLLIVIAYRQDVSNDEIIEYIQYQYETYILAEYDSIFQFIDEQVSNDWDGQTFYQSDIGIQTLKNAYAIEDVKNQLKYMTPNHVFKVAGK